ncbi:biopolymer transporter ExbD [Cytophagales bacterium LB-30]|uniref:Biopolymer transporter ExbD n=1 Tax=Shiella aurantiaca TaxID=3058365 RepID=A0ABT8F1Q6_9BACT|nr:biopolymer transporter ExbD [Shiella aurantiaca]MDN4164382.1 biopolymer transporter ExbD [Shiella aurantiaca]
MAKKQRANPTVNSSSMADIAFLLLIFFLVTTTIASDKGILFQLPPKPDPNEPPPDIKFNQRNIFKILINSNDKMLVEDEPMDDISQLKGKVKEFVLNNGKNKELSDSPKDAIISLKADRGTSYEKFITVLDILETSYNEMYGARVGLTADQFRELDLKNPVDKERYDRARENFPKNISIAEPTN